MNEFELRGKRPHYMCFIFGVRDISCMPLGTYTKSAPAVPDVPPSDYRYSNITNTIHSYPHLFPIITLIDADCLKLLLHNHPNTALISSICCSFRSGFWPFANTEKPENSPEGCIMQSHGPPTLDDKLSTFLRSQCDIEMSLGQYSQAFGATLLPGMVAQPVFTIPKKGTAKLHLINDHSAILKSLNSLIPMQGGFVVLDNLSDLGAI